MVLKDIACSLLLAPCSLVYI